MVTEFEIRREIAAIDSSSIDGVRKARKLLRLARRVQNGALTLAHLSLRKLQEGDGDAAARFRTAARRLVDLHDEIRVSARATLSPDALEARELTEVLA